MKRTLSYFSRGRIRPLLFRGPLNEKDRSVLLRQMKGRAFDPSLVSAVVRRCPKGFPAVIQCASLKKGKPFPTSFWLTCPWLVRLCGVRESEGAVTVLEEALKKDRAQWTGYHCHAARIRILSLSPAERQFLQRFRPKTWRVLSRGGVGGIDYRRGGGVKCLHLQVASWLAIGWHPAEALLGRMMEPRVCDASSKWECICSYDSIRKELCPCGKGVLLNRPPLL